MENYLRVQKAWKLSQDNAEGAERLKVDSFPLWNACWELSCCYKQDAAVCRGREKSLNWELLIKTKQLTANTNFTIDLNVNIIVYITAQLRISSKIKLCWITHRSKAINLLHIYWLLILSPTVQSRYSSQVNIFILQCPKKMY